MFNLFRTLADRLKALFVADVGLDFEAPFAARDAQRKAELLRQAASYQDEGLGEVANELRRRAEALSDQRPLDSVLPALAQGQKVETWPAALPLEKPAEPMAAEPGPAATPRRPARRKKPCRPS
jgi:hypothetical protein